MLLRKILKNLLYLNDFQFLDNETKLNQIQKAH